MNPAIAYRKPGAKPAIRSVRSATPADLDLLRKRRTPTTITRIRDSHHRIAWLIASGMSHVNIAAALGMSTVRISQLTTDPAFNELLASKRAHVEANHAAAADELTLMAKESLRRAERQIIDRLELADADPDTHSIPLRDLARITSDRMDRFGYGKHTTSTSISIDFAAKLEAAISRSRKTG